MNAESEARDLENMLGAARYFDWPPAGRSIYAGLHWNEHDLEALARSRPAGIVKWVPNEIQGLQIDAIWIDDFEEEKFVDERLLLLCPPSSF